MVAASDDSKRILMTIAAYYLDFRCGVKQLAIDMPLSSSEINVSTHIHRFMTNAVSCDRHRPAASNSLVMVVEFMSITPF